MTLRERIAKNQPGCLATSSKGACCELGPGHTPADIHRGAGIEWGSRDPWMAPWRRNLTGRDNTRAVLEGGPL